MDAGIYRERGIPSVNCGLTSYNMGNIYRVMN